MLPFTIEPSRPSRPCRDLDLLLPALCRHAYSASIGMQRSLGIKIAAFVGLGCVCTSVLPAIKQAKGLEQASTLSIDTNRFAGSDVHVGDGHVETKRWKRNSVLSDENALGVGGHGPRGNVSCPKLLDIVSCPSASTQDDVLYCRDCISHPIEATYRVTSSELSAIKPPDHKIYMPILVPPFFGSSVLANILSSSPFVTNMCKDPYSKGRIPWQCESTPTLVQEGILTKKTRWDPLAMNWTAAYDTYERLRVWKDMEKPIRLDKGPPNIAKSKQLMEYYDANGMDYRVVVMIFHPCRRDWGHPKFPTLRYSVYLREILKFVPEEKRFLINYDDLVTRPGVVLRDLLSWFPLLTSLTIDSDELRPKKMNLEAGKRKLRGAHAHGGSLLSYIQSDKCVLSLHQNSTSTPSDEIELWDAVFPAKLSS